ncbi:hypothetical protein NXV26_23225 [Bacteroides fragilis]|nr:hypothetical protein [Bacteroides fragilis]
MIKRSGFDTLIDNPGQLVLLVKVMREWGKAEVVFRAPVNYGVHPLRRLEEGGWSNSKTQNTLINLALDS